MQQRSHEKTILFKKVFNDFSVEPTKEIERIQQWNDEQFYKNFYREI